MKAWQELQPFCRSYAGTRSSDSGILSSESMSNQTWILLPTYELISLKSVPCEVTWGKASVTARRLSACREPLPQGSHRLWTSAPSTAQPLPASLTFPIFSLFHCCPEKVTPEESAAPCWGPPNGLDCYPSHSVFLQISNIQEGS